jgi:TolA-binding protein
MMKRDATIHPMGRPVPRRRWRRGLAALAALAVLAAGLASEAAAGEVRRRRRRSDEEGAATDEQTRIERRAREMISQGRELLRLRQEERAVKVLQQVPRMFPEAQARFQAYLELGKHYLEQRKLEEAIEQFDAVEESEDDGERAEALYRIGICHYEQNQYEQAFMVLRRVTTEYRWSVYANEAFYYIGLCHFKLNRWAKADEALRMVGTSVPPTLQEQAYAEAGQRLYVKVSDQDLSVLMRLGEAEDIVVEAASGDREAIELEPLGRRSRDFIGSLRTALGEATAADGVLQIKGGDTVEVLYLDRNTESGSRDEKRLYSLRMVSSAAVGFTDGAYREYAKGVFGDQMAFVRVKDLDGDTSDQADTLTVRVFSHYKLEREDDPERRGVELEEEEERWVDRDSLELPLTETAPHSGLFTGTIMPRVVDETTATLEKTPETLFVREGDEVVVEYVDQLHLDGDEPRLLADRVPVVIGTIPNVESKVYTTSDPNLQARKQLIESQILLKWAGIFRDVGLMEKAREKSGEGLERVDEVIRASARANLERELVEQGFAVKWELLLVQDRLREAISVCHALTRLFPDSNLADRAFLQIAQAKVSNEEYREALPILASVVRLPNARREIKAEAQYTIGLVHEEMAMAAAQRHAARGGNARPNLSEAIRNYRTCAETYPDTPHAGEALQKIVNYYIHYRDYPRAVELLERIFQDYPDKTWLDEMLLKWGVVAYRMEEYQTSYEKFMQVLQEYPGGPAAAKARQYLKAVQKKLQRGGDNGEA